MSWTPDEWKPCVPLLPVITIDGALVWLRRCEYRKLRYLYKDGYDHLRDIRSCTQFRRAPSESL
jgi:hypothetical protein